MSIESLAGNDLATMVDWVIWLAALIDCTGTIAVVRRWTAGHWAHSLTVAVRSPHLALLTRAQEIARSGRIRPAQASGETHTYWWRVTNEEAATLMAAVRPYLIVQAIRADAALAIEHYGAEPSPGDDPQLDELYEVARPMRQRFTRLTSEQMAEIRTLQGSMTQRELADRFRVSTTTISRLFAAYARQLDEEAEDETTPD